MPWKETRVPDERLKFIAEVPSGEERMADLCRRFGISRKTGYKWKKRYEVSCASIRRLPKPLDEIKYGERHIVRPVRRNGTIRWNNKGVFITEVLRRERVGFLATSINVFHVYFGELSPPIPS